MKKKLLSVLLSAAMLAGVLAGCGSSAQTENTSSNAESAPAAESTAASEAAAETTAESAAEVDPASVTGEFTYWTYTDSANNLVNAFNEVYPNVKIDLQVFGGDEYKTKILTALQRAAIMCRMYLTWKKIICTNSWTAI